MDVLLALVSSKEFWAAVVTLVVLVAKAYYPPFPFTDVEVLGFVLTVVGLILGINFNAVAKSNKELTQTLRGYIARLK